MLLSKLSKDTKKRFSKW